MADLREEVDRASRIPIGARLHGEPGTGKELVARALHEWSAVASGPFVAVNLAASDRGLIASQLFGHVRGERRTAGQRAQRLASYLTSANRSFKFARRVDSRGFSRAIASMKRRSAPLVRDMDAFAGRTSNDKLRRELRVFKSFVDDSGDNGKH